MRFILISLFSFIGLTLLANNFDINNFSDPKKYGWDNIQKQKEYREELIEKQRLLQIYNLKNQSVLKNSLKSALMPGLGHFSTGNNTKGEILLCTEFTILGFGYYFYDRAMTNYDRYKKSSTTYDIKDYYQKARRDYNFSQQFLGLAVLIWGYSIFDVIISTMEYNDNLWYKIEKNYKDNKKIIITPLGFHLRF